MTGSVTRDLQNLCYFWSRCPVWKTKSW